MPLLDAFLTMMWFFLWVLWFFLLFRIIMDIFRSKDMNGWGKAGWLAFVIILPFLGVFVYLIARGHKMTERDVAQAQEQDRAFRAYVQEAAHETGTADELTKLADLRDRGVISEADFQQGKDKILKTAIGTTLPPGLADRPPDRRLHVRLADYPDRPLLLLPGQAGRARHHAADLRIGFSQARQHVRAVTGMRTKGLPSSALRCHL